MSAGHAQHESIEERTKRALEELETLIAGRYPQASFAVVHGEDPEGVYLKATVDLDDVDEVMDVYRDRLLDIQVDEGLLVYVIPLQPVERVLEALCARDARFSNSALPGAAINP